MKVKQVVLLLESNVKILIQPNSTVKQLVLLGDAW